MKIAFLFGFLFFTTIGFTQVNPPDSVAKISDTLKLADSIKLHSADQKAAISDTVKISSPGNPKPGYSIYGELLNDNPVYNRRYGWLIPATRVIAANAFNWGVNRYVFNYDWSHISFDSWRQNLRSSWEWDNDKFGINFIGHPHSGNIYFNIARSNGYNFWQSFPFAVEGSLMWEYFGETTKPSRNDMINTPISGAFLGEVLYRISSNILDDRTRGGERFFRELFAGILAPSRAMNRLTQGKMFRVTSDEVYQEEPLNITLSGGVHRVNDNKFGSGGTNAIFNLQLDYGDPFEIRHRKPFDVFRLRIESKYGTDKKILDNVLGYGELFSKNITKGNFGMLMGLFQQFDYWNNNIFELGSLGFGPGIISRLSFGKNSDLYSGWHLAIVPLAGNNTRFGPDTSLYRDYNFGGGTEGRIEETLNLSKWLALGFNGYYYWIHPYEGLPGNSLIGIIKPRIAVKLFGNTSLGFEHSIYYHDRFIKNGKIPDVRLVKAEQKFFLQVFLEDKRRRGKYQ